MAYLYPENTWSQKLIHFQMEHYTYVHLVFDPVSVLLGPINSMAEVRYLVLVKLHMIF
jgi:hypothetical protein